MTVPELLAPAGDLEKLQAALDYGADAVYAGTGRFGLRAMAGNLSPAELVQARDLVRQRGRRLYLTLNAYLLPEEMAPLADLLEELRPLDLDGYIVSDPGVVALVRRVDPDRPLHLSTQANTTNAEAVRFWSRLGVRRCNLARELSLDQIRAIRAETDTEIEVFVHGALCVAVSGRCLLSAALTDRSANRGACTHPCRWGYALVEETRPGEYLPIEEDGRGSYLLNSRDLCLIDRLPELIEAGVDSLKIEGRMKSVYYVAAVTRVYRAALDAWAADPSGYRPDPLWRQELERVSHRPYGEGFLFPDGEARLTPAESRYRRQDDFVGKVTAGDGGELLVEGRNRFFAGERLELIGPGMRQQAFAAADLATTTGEATEVVQPNALVRMALPPGARPGDLIRRPHA